MSAYIKREGNKRFGGGGKSSFGARSGKPSFSKKSWGDSRSSGPIKKFKATCSKCGESCEVPFKPVNGKPVFCRNCFIKTGDTGAGRAGDKFPKRDFRPRSYVSASSAPDSGNNEVLKQLEIMNTKLERLIHAVEASASSASNKEDL